MEKRVYALRDFYSRELKGTLLDDPASDPLVTGTLAALVLLIGRKAMHVPKVRATELGPIGARVGSSADTDWAELAPQRGRMWGTVSVGSVPGVMALREYKFSPS